MKNFFFFFFVHNEFRGQWDDLFSFHNHKSQDESYFGESISRNGKYTKSCTYNNLISE
jgi:hypothetical protein